MSTEDAAIGTLRCRYADNMVDRRENGPMIETRRYFTDDGGHHQVYSHTTGSRNVDYGRLSEHTGEYHNFDDACRDRNGEMHERVYDGCHDLNEGTAVAKHGNYSVCPYPGFQTGVGRVLDVSQPLHSELLAYSHLLNETTAKKKTT